MDITEFVKARLDEAEVALNRSRSAPEGATRFTDVDEWDEELVWTFANSNRVQREVAAKRARLAAYIAASAAVAKGADPYMAGVADGLRIAVKNDADVWNDHPDYDPQWTP